MRRAPLLLFMLPACGFLGESDFAGARQAAGSAPWTNLGAATLCQGSTFFGPPDSDPVGICIPQSARPGRLCLSDAACRSRERCVCGTCTVQICDGPAQCGSGNGRDCNFRTNVCGLPCSAQQGCPGQDVCDRGFCTSACLQDRDCQTGETCSPTHRCISAFCHTTSECIGGIQDCQIQRNPGDLREPALLDDPLLLFVELRPTVSTGQIVRAQSGDGGRSFSIDPAAPVLAPTAAERRLGAPAVARRGTTLLLFFEEPDGIGRALSSDNGRTFQRDPAPVVRADQAWEAGLVGSPGAAVLGDQTVLLFYEGGGGAGIGLATSQDGASFIKPSARPVVDAIAISDPTLWRQIDRVGQPAARRALDPVGREGVSLWFAAHGVESAATLESGMLVPPVANNSIGYAASLDRGRTFAPFPFNPVFDRIENFRQHDQESTPTVAPVGDRFLMLYGGADPQGHATGLGIAVNPAP
ncbi:MAG TPA: hypothetical protein VKN99_24510 [Polyangia bacterium]|nr:hypothetical protein [Polyangia bacterium]